MIGLTTVTEENWIEISKLSVNDEQQKFLDRTIGIIARGYVYRYCNGRVVAITNDDQIVGVALIRDLDEEPACYDLQQFMIDQRFQNKGYGTEGLKKILSILESEKKYNCTEVCVHKDDIAALRLYKKVGFVDTGYVDDDAPDCLNLMYYFKEKE